VLLLVGNALLVHDLPQSAGMIGKTSTRHDKDDRADNDQAGGDKKVSALVPKVSHDGVYLTAMRRPTDDKEVTTCSPLALPSS
jgi:hypothetical protein